MYRETQIGWIVIIPLILISIFVTIAMIIDWNENPLPMMVLLVVPTINAMIDPGINPTRKRGRRGVGFPWALNVLLRTIAVKQIIPSD